MKKTTVRGESQGDGNGDNAEQTSFRLPEPRDLVHVEMALSKLEGLVNDKVTKEEAEAVARVCWDNAKQTAEYFCRVAGGGQKDYPSSALRRLLQTSYRYMRKWGSSVTEDTYGAQAAFYLLGSEMFHMARTTSKDEVGKFFVACGNLVRKLADCNDPRRPTGQGLIVFLERVICFAERYAITKSSSKQSKYNRNKKPGR